MPRALEYFTVHTHANQHVGFPGATSTSSCTQGTDGRILGASRGATGDRRIDVIATAMRAGLSATDPSTWTRLRAALRPGQTPSNCDRHGCAWRADRRACLTGPAIKTRRSWTCAGEYARGRAHAELTHIPPHPAARLPG